MQATAAKVDARVPKEVLETVRAPDPALVDLCRVAGFYRIGADPDQLRHELALNGRLADHRDICRAAATLGLKTRVITAPKSGRLARVPTPALLHMGEAGTAILLSVSSEGVVCLLKATESAPRHVGLGDLNQVEAVVLLARDGLPRKTADRFDVKWFLPSILRHKKVMGHVLVASLFLQIFALLTPLLFQIVVDKVLPHKGVATLTVVTIAVIGLALFNAILQYLRTYTLSHTTTRIDVELGARLFHHLLRLPLAYFETRAAGQTVARLRELETIRSFITGQALSSLIDLLFTFVFVIVLACYSPLLTLVVLGSVPAYVLITALVRPVLRDKIREQFNRGAVNQQFLVETVVGIHTLKASAVEPAMQSDWEEKLSGFVKSAFDATMVSALGQSTIQYVSALTNAATIFFGAKLVMDGDMSIGQLIAFNMIAGQLTQPILRLSQLFQDVQQVQVSIERLGDVLNTPSEPQTTSAGALPAIQGAVDFQGVNFRYRAGGAHVLRDITLSIRPGETIGIVGASGSGKSTLSKLMQRFYLPEEGRILIDGVDIREVDPSWLRRQTGVVLQENILFNRSIHENIAFSNPALPRAHVMQVARLAGAHDFIINLPSGYDTIIEERGANLSGGQRQRVAIARALATDPRILIFDEATSALDYESEQTIQRNMSAIVRGRTVVIIAHRLSTVQVCNRIVGMDGGRIVEVGSHDELLRHEHGVYANLWRLQTQHRAIAS